MQKGGKKVPFLAYSVFDTANGPVAEATCMIEFNIEWSSQSSFARPWVPVQTAVVQEAWQPGGIRVSGLWTRYVFYTATAPNNQGKLYMSETQTGLRSLLPTCDVQGAKIQQPWYPLEGDPGYGWLPEPLFKELLYVPSINPSNW